MIPQIIYIVLVGLGFAAVLVQKTSTYDFGASFFAGVLAMTLFAFGGFFASFGIPQVAIILWYSFALGVNIAKHGQTVRTNIPRAFVVQAVIVAMLAWDGFFTIA